jgi:hypothetical protein
MYIFCYHYALLEIPSPELAVRVKVPSARGELLKQCDFPIILGSPFFPLQVGISHSSFLILILISIPIPFPFPFPFPFIRNLLVHWSNYLFSGGFFSA